MFAVDRKPQASQTHALDPKPASKRQAHAQPVVSGPAFDFASPPITLPSTALPESPSIALLQPKLRVGASNDPLEQEADRLAKRVMSMHSVALPDGIPVSPGSGETTPRPQIRTAATADQDAPPQRMCTAFEQKAEKKLDEATGDDERQDIHRRIDPDAFDEDEDDEASSGERAHIQRRVTPGTDDEASARGTSQARSASAAGLTLGHDAESAIEAARTGGQPLSMAERAFFEPRFGHDFSRVRIHAESSAAAAARAVNAHAFALGSDIVFGAGQYAPNTHNGQRLLAHELAHVIQQGHAGALAGSAAAAGSLVRGREAQRANEQLQSGWKSLAVQMSPASDLISEHTSWGDLDEVELGRKLAERVLDGDLGSVNQVIDELGWFNRDDVGVEVLRALTDGNLDTLVASSSTREVLHRLYDLVTAGNLSPTEMADADRVIHAEVRALPPSEWDQQAETAPIIPYGEPGVLAFGASPVMAERRPGGRIWVRFTVNGGYSQLTREEALRTPVAYATSGVELPARQIVVVKHLDDGGRYEPRPALYLLQIANQTNTATAEALGTAVGGGLSLGIGGLAMGGGRAATSLLVRLGMSASTAARVLTVLDAAAMSLAVVTQLIHDNRGWIISRFGDAGRLFVSANDIVSIAAMAYGLTRLVVEMPRTIARFRNAYRQWRAAKAGVTGSLDADQIGTANKIESQAGEFLAQVDEVDAVKTGNRTGLSDQIPEHTSNRLGSQPTKADLVKIKNKYKIGSDSEAQAIRQAELQKSTKEIVAGEDAIKKTLGIDPKQPGVKMVDFMKTLKNGLKVPTEVKNMKTIDLVDGSNAALKKFEEIAKHGNMEGLSHFEIMANLESKLPPNFMVDKEGKLYRLIGGTTSWESVTYGGKVVKVTRASLGGISK